MLTKEVQYIIANPTFHHWHTEDQRFGLTFQSCRDANAFEQGIEKVVEDLFQGEPCAVFCAAAQHCCVCKILDRVSFVSMLNSRRANADR